MTLGGWGDTARGLVKPIPETADSLAGDLQDLSDVDCIHFEKVVETEGPRGYSPKCVDCIARSGKKMYMIEFKPLPHCGGDDIRGSLALKVIESAYLYRRFLSQEFGDLDLGFILVVQDHREEIRSVYERRAGMDPMSDMARYSKRDRSGDVMFYDSVEMMGCNDFMRIARKRFSRKNPST